MIRHRAASSFLAAVLCAAAWPAFAQSPNTSSLVVVVEDEQGAVVPHAGEPF